MWRRYSSGQNETIQLIRSMPKYFTGYLDARSGFLRWIREYNRYFAEFRDAAILLYPMPKEHARSGSLSVAQRAASEPALGDTTAVDLNDDEQLNNYLDSVPSAKVIIIALREASLRGRESAKSVVIKRPDGSGSIQLRLDDLEQYKLWWSHIEAAVKKRKVTLADFEIVKHIGKGASGRVYLVRDVRNDEQLALKVIEKSSVVESADAYRHALDERIVLEQACKHPFILDMRYAFQNIRRLFLVTEYCGGGDLFEFLTRLCKPMSEEKARVVVAEILLALEKVHSLGVVYRDLKLENVLLDSKGHVRVADFGLAKTLRGKDGSLQRTKTFCGTREYVAPEMLADQEYDFSVDYWTIGILLYEILCGRTPFFSANRNEIYPRIEKAPIFYPRELSLAVKDLLAKLLERDPRKRLGNDGGIGSIMQHEWFNSVDWDAVRRMDDHPLEEEVREFNAEYEEEEDSSEQGRKSKRQIAQEKAMKNLLADVAADVANAEPNNNVNVGSSAGGKGTGGNDMDNSNAAMTQMGGSSGSKSAFGIKSRKRVPILAGYSFIAHNTSSSEAHARARTELQQQNKKRYAANSSAINDDEEEVPYEGATERETISQQAQESPTTVVL